MHVEQSENRRDEQQDLLGQLLLSSDRSSGFSPSAQSVRFRFSGSRKPITGCLKLQSPSAQLHRHSHYLQRQVPQRRLSGVKLSASRREPKEEPLDLSILFLLGASALWGTYPSTIKCFFASPGSDISAGEITLIRFLVMAAVSGSAYSAVSTGDSSDTRQDSAKQPHEDSPALPWSEQFSRRVPGSIYLAAAELGAIGLVGSYFNTLGLKSIPALTGAVLLTFLNIFTPLIAFLFGATEKERAVDGVTWTTSLLALGACTYALLPDSTSADELKSILPSLGPGELATLAAAFFFGAVKVRLSSHLKWHPADALTTGRLVSQAGLAALGLGITDETTAVRQLMSSEMGGMGLTLMDVVDEAERWLIGISPQQVFWIVLSSMLSGVIAVWCQGRGQSTVSAPKAQLFYSTSPLFGALWALLLLQEPITNHELTGGAALLAGLIAASFFPEASLEEESRAEPRKVSAE